MLKNNVSELFKEKYSNKLNRDCIVFEKCIKNNPKNSNCEGCILFENGLIEEIVEKDKRITFLENIIKGNIEEIKMGTFKDFKQFVIETCSNTELMRHKSFQFRMSFELVKEAIEHNWIRSLSVRRHSNDNDIFVCLLVSKKACSNDIFRYVIDYFCLNNNIFGTMDYNISIDIIDR